MNIKIRNARTEDIGSIFNLWVESMKFHEELDPHVFGFDMEKADAGEEFIRGQLNKDSAIMFVAEHDAKIIAYLLGEIRSRLPFQKLQTIGYIFDIVVQKEYRRKGIGTMLLMKVSEFFKIKGIETVMLSVSEMNKSAISFYEKHKFTTYLRNMMRGKL